jgi:hypothetical protein
LVAEDALTPIHGEDMENLFSLSSFYFSFFLQPGPTSTFSFLFSFSFSSLTSLLAPTSPYFLILSLFICGRRKPPRKSRPEVGLAVEATGAGRSRREALREAAGHAQLVGAMQRKKPEQGNQRRGEQGTKEEQPMG